MASGRPDFHPTMLLEGKRLNSLIPVLVDPLGQLYTIMSGESGAGFVPIKVDVDGQITALIKGEYLGNPAMVALDADGLIKVNLTVQDLNYIKVRPVYGQVKLLRVADFVIPDGEEIYAHDFLGKGAIVGGWLYCGHGASVGLMEIHLYTDEVLIFSETFDGIYSRYPIGGVGGFVSCNQYIDAIGAYRFTFIAPITFESRMTVGVYNPYGYDVTISCTVFYALVP